MQVAGYCTMGGRMGGMGGGRRGGCMEEVCGGGVHADFPFWSPPNGTMREFQQFGPSNVVKNSSNQSAGN